jgi:hypothetical protein
MNDLTHIMLDLETLGTVPGCVGFSIGAVVFDPHAQKLGSEFYTVINVDSCLDRYLREEEDTKKWWAGQSDEAKVALLEARDPTVSVPLVEALENFNGWQRAQALSKNIRMWGNGADFDNPILRVMYDAAGIKPYANGFGGRCYRTLKNLDELFGPAFAFTKVERTGTHHNALDDAKTQAIHLMENLKRIRKEVTV